MFFHFKISHMDREKIYKKYHARLTWNISNWCRYCFDFTTINIFTINPSLSPVRRNIILKKRQHSSNHKKGNITFLWLLIFTYLWFLSYGLKCAILLIDFNKNYFIENYLAVVTLERGSRTLNMCHSNVSFFETQ